MIKIRMTMRKQKKSNMKNINENKTKMKNEVSENLLKNFENSISENKEKILSFLFDALS